MHLQELPRALDQLAKSHRLRVPDDGLHRQRLAVQWGDGFIDAARNDYLGLAGDVSRETSAPAGAGASRLIFGSATEHLRLEQDVARWLGYPAALLFSSGYAANLGALSALISPEDAVFSDRLNHASLIDGIRLSRAKARLFEHLDLDELEAGLRSAAGEPARWVVVEAYYSMDGDGPDLARLREMCDRYDAALYVDEAHSLGTFGPRGAGLSGQFGVRPDVLMAGFGKAVGSQGACVLGSIELRTWLWNRARSFVFSTAPSPVQTASLRTQIERTRGAESGRAHLATLASGTRERLIAAGAPLVPGSFGPVLSLLCGSEEAASSLAARLQDAGVLAQAIRPPTVPAGASRVRLILSARLSDDQAKRLTDIVARETCPKETHA